MKTRILTIAILMLVALVCDARGAYIRQGMSGCDTIVYNIDGKYIRQGMSSAGTIIFNIDR